jgi:hypothetical protein
MPAWGFATGDAIAILLFAVIGLSNHREGITVAGLARNALPIIAVWFAIAPLVHTYSSPGFRTMLVSWAISVPVGVAIRAAVLRRDADSSQLVFGLITLVTTLVLLSAWRLMASWLTSRA